jgi:hypothetical protein
MLEETQRLRDGLVGGVLGSTAGMVALLWWPHASTADTMAVFGAGTVIGLLLGLALGRRCCGGSGCCSTPCRELW